MGTQLFSDSGVGVIPCTKTDTSVVLYILDDVGRGYARIMSMNKIDIFYYDTVSVTCVRVPQLPVQQLEIFTNYELYIIEVQLRRI